MTFCVNSHQKQTDNDPESDANASNKLILDEDIKMKPWEGMAMTRWRESLGEHENESLLMMMFLVRIHGANFIVSVCGRVFDKLIIVEITSSYNSMP